MTQQICFIVGMNRSGTTLLHSLLSGHSAIFATDIEDGMITGLSRAAADFEHAIRKRDLALLRRLLHYHTQYLTLSMHSMTGTIAPQGQWGGQRERIEIAFDYPAFERDFLSRIADITPTSRRLKVGSMAEVIRAFYAALADHRGEGDKPIAVSKPGRGADLFLQVEPMLGDLCPMLLCIERDPRAVISSHLKKKSSTPIKRLAAEWREGQEAIAALRRSGRTPMKVIRYEDLCQAPEQVMTEVAEFLKIPFEPVLVQPQVAGTSYSGNSSYGALPEQISPESIDRWKDSLSAGQVREIEGHVGRHMLNAGYTLMHGPQPIAWQVEGIAAAGEALRKRVSRAMPKTRGRSALVGFMVGVVVGMVVLGIIGLLLGWH